MKLIIPMAGIGKRLRPHTLTTPKPLIPLAGKPIVRILAEDLISIAKEKVDEIAFVIGNFGKEVEERLLAVAKNLDAKGKIYYQLEALGTGHAILCAKESLKGKIIIAFADTLFRSDFKLKKDLDAVIWVKEIENPSQFGVVKLNAKKEVTAFVEKPKTFISNLAIIGIYYFADGAYLRKELQNLIDKNIKEHGEFQLTNAMSNMLATGKKFGIEVASEWMDCGNKDALIDTNTNILQHLTKNNKLRQNKKYDNSVITEPCFIGGNVMIENSKIGPNVAIGEGTKISHSVIYESIVMNSAIIKNVSLNRSIIGNHCTVSQYEGELNLGDFNAVGK